MFKCNVLYSVRPTFWGFAKVAIFNANFNAENQTLIHLKYVCGVHKSQFCQTRVIGSMFFFDRCFVCRFGHGLAQTHFLPSFGLSVGLCGLAMCMAVKRWLSHCNHFAG
jgi:hypothetical protein